MNLKYGICAVALAVTASVAPLSAQAALKDSETAAIKAAVDAAMKTGETGKLQALLAATVSANSADAGAVTDLVTQQIVADMAANPSATVPGSTTTIAEAVTTSSINSIVAAAPQQAGTVLGEAQTILTGDLQVAAITATQTALTPAAGGNNNQNRGNANQLVADIKQLLQVLVQTAEIPRRSTASPSS